MLGNVDYGIQSLDQSSPLGPDVFRLKQGRWVQVQTPTIQQRRSAYISQTAFLSPDEFWGVGTSFWWTGTSTGTSSGYNPTVTPLITHYKDGVWTVVED